jgi:hypothetical protein
LELQFRETCSTVVLRGYDLGEGAAVQSVLGTRDPGPIANPEISPDLSG